jgi:hypothetical protein
MKDDYAFNKHWEELTSGQKRFLKNSFQDVLTQMN